jgi:hypothetical protein
LKQIAKIDLIKIKQKAVLQSNVGQTGIMAQTPQEI